MQTFNAEILAAVAAIDQNWKGKGYDLHSYFTHDLAYGPDCCIKANHPPLTMCVAAVTEIIVEALNGYFAKTQDSVPFQKLPIRSWRGGSRSDIRAHIFMYDGLHCSGTAHALERFGIGRQTSFEQLQPGSFINLNRTAGSGHACVFLSYLDAAGNDVASYGPSVAGFKYFSSQGKGSPDGGFGYRWGFFDGHCPTSLPNGRRRDCGIIRSAKPNLLCCGVMLHPASWPSGDIIARGVAESLSAVTEGMNDLTPDELAQEMARELPAPDLSRFDGVTTD